MFERLKTLYKDGKITESGLANAVAKGWISNTEKAEILSAQI